STENTPRGSTDCDSSTSRCRHSPDQCTVGCCLPHRLPGCSPHTEHSGYAAKAPSPLMLNVPPESDGREVVCVELWCIARGAQEVVRDGANSKMMGLALVAPGGAQSCVAWSNSLSFFCGSRAGGSQSVTYMDRQD